MATPNVITYAYIRGRWYAFPDSASAYDGVARYNGNAQSLRYSKPVGAIIDEVTLMDSGFWPDVLLDGYKLRPPRRFLSTSRCYNR